MNLTKLREELGAYYRTNNKEVSSMVYGESEMAAHMKDITKVKGQYPTIHTITTHVVQAFQSIWTPLGTTKFEANKLEAFHQKVNFKITPSEIENSWLAELYNKKMKPEDMPISKYIVENELKPKVVEDTELLMGQAVYDAAKKDQFGFSMNGVTKILADGITNGSMFKIPLTPLTDSNIVAQVEEFEKKIPAKVEKSIKKIYMSSINAKRYKADYRAKYNQQVDYSKNQLMKTYFGDREIIGLSNLNGSNVIFGTPEGNFLRLIDVLESAPQVTDVQVADYDVKIFMEWWLGVGFYINQLVLVSDYVGQVTGLKDAETTNLYFPTLPAQA